MKCSDGTCKENCNDGNGGTEGNNTLGYTATQISLTSEDLNQVTSSIIMEATCSLDSNCLPYEDLNGNTNYTVKCMSTAITQSKVEEASKEVCKDTYSIFSFKFLTSSTAAVCAGSLAISIVTAGSATPITAVICATSIAGAVTIGAAQSSLESGCEIFKQKGAQGICIATPISSGFLDTYLGWAAFYDIDRNGIKNGTDGVIMIGIILFGILIYNKFQ